MVCVVFSVEVFQQQNKILTDREVLMFRVLRTHNVINFEDVLSFNVTKLVKMSHVKIINISDFFSNVSNNSMAYKF